MLLRQLLSHAHDLRTLSWEQKRDRSVTVLIHHVHLLQSVGSHQISLGDSRQLALNVLVDATIDKLGSDANRVLNRVRVRRSVRDETCPLHPEQRSAAIFGVVQALLEIAESTAREQVSNLPGDGLRQRLFQGGAHQVDHAFGTLQRDVADESVGYDHVDLAVVNIAAFDVADEIQGKLLHELERLAG